MLAALSSIFRKECIPALSRFLHCSKTLYETKEDVDVTFCLKPVTHTAQTIRKHDNCKRQWLYEFGIYVATCLPKYVQKIQMQHNDELEILVAPQGSFQVLSFLRNHQNAQFNFCSGVTAVDVPTRQYRFEVIYFLQSMRYGERARVKTYTDELTPIHSACELWSGLNWFEREVYDMFGIVFTHHPDLRRLLTDYGFEGHPLRKDFPLIGYTEVRYDDEQKRVVYEPVEYAQQFRRYSLDSPWTFHKNFHEGYNKPPKPKPK